jgi:hypothetical protein
MLGECGCHLNLPLFKDLRRFLIFAKIITINYCISFSQFCWTTMMIHKIRSSNCHYTTPSCSANCPTPLQPPPPPSANNRNNFLLPSSRCSCPALRPPHRSWAAAAATAATPLATTTSPTCLACRWRRRIANFWPRAWPDWRWTFRCQFQSLEFDRQIFKN